MDTLLVLLGSLFVGFMSGWVFDSWAKIMRDNFDFLSIPILLSLILQLRKPYYIFSDWEHYTPMLEVGELLGFTPINFAQEPWRGIWTIVHLGLVFRLASAGLTKSWEHLADGFTSPHFMFLGWILLNCFRFGGFGLVTALAVNLGTLLLMEVTKRNKQRMLYRLFVSLPSLVELVIFCYIYLFIPVYGTAWIMGAIFSFW